MGILSRIGSAVRSVAMRFAARSSEGWGYLSRRARQDAYQAGNGSTSSIVQAAVGWIARNFPEAQVRVQTRNEDGELAKATDDGSLAFLRLLRHPNAFYSGVLLWMATIADYWLDGNSYWLKVRGEGDRVIGLWWVPSFVIEPAWPDDGSAFMSHYVYKPTGDVEIRLETTEVVHFRFGFDPDNIRKGRSPIKTVLREILTDEEAASYTSTVLRNLGVPGIVISPGADDVDLGDDEAAAIKQQFMTQFTGDRRGDPLVLSANARVDRISFSPSEMDMRTIRRIPEERVSGVIGVPAIVAGLGAGLDRSTFANYGEAREAGYEENIIPSHRLLSADLEIQLLPDFVADPEEHVVDFDVSEVRVLQEDENKRWARAGAALTQGAITISDFNRLVGLPVDEALHDVYLRSATVVAIRRDSPEATGEEPAEDPEPAPDLAPVPSDLSDVIAVPVQGGNGARPAVPVG